MVKHYIADLPGRVKRLKENTSLCACDNQLFPYTVETIKQFLNKYLNNKFAKKKNTNQKSIRLNTILETIDKMLSDATSNGQKLLYCKTCNSVYFLEEENTINFKLRTSLKHDEKDSEALIARTSIKVSKEEIESEREQMKDMSKSLYSD